MLKEPLRHAILIAHRYQARSMLFQRRGGIFHGIAFIGDAEHGNIIQGISKGNNAVTFPQFLQSVYGICLGGLFGHDLTPVLRLIQFLLKGTGKKAACCNSFIKRLKSFLFTDTGKIKNIACVQSFFIRYRIKPRITLPFSQIIKTAFIFRP